MMRRSLHALTLLMLLAGLLLTPGAVAAQNYSFSVPAMRMQVLLQADGTARVIYDIAFRNSAGGHPIDIVDIGMPHDDYNIGNMRASINGVSLSNIRPSTYIDTGVEVHLAQQTIPSGGSGTLRFEFTIADLVYQDTTDESYASFQITPTWFDSGAITGRTDLWIIVYTLPGIEPDEVLYQDEPFTNKVIYAASDGDRVAVGWHYPEARLTGAHRVGVSFPQRGMSNIVRMTRLQLVSKWLEDNPNVHGVLLAVFLLIFTILFFRFTGGTGASLYIPLLTGLVILGIVFPVTILLGFLPLVGLVALNERALRKRTTKYLPPIAQVEGGGIKRGLSAPEAAVLLEMPLNKVLTLVIFGLLEKGILQQVQPDPLTVQPALPFVTRADAELTKDRNKRIKFRRRAAQEAGTVIHNYEQAFLDIIERNPEKPLESLDFGGAMRTLLQETANKMKGFDLSDTRDYYRRIIARAWEQAQALGEVPAREEFLDKYFPWVVMNDSYPTVLTMGGYHYWPRWARRVPLSGAGGARGFAPAGSGRSGTGGRTTFGDVSASFAGWAEKTMGGMAAAILPGSLQGPRGSKGLVNLSGIDRVTGDIFEAMASSSGSGGSGGGGSGCACACAGCACACACAGGGR